MDEDDVCKVCGELFPGEYCDCASFPNEELGMFDLNELLSSDKPHVRTCNICLSDKPCTCMHDLVMDQG
jgi:hypothetical protein